MGRRSQRCCETENMFDVKGVYFVTTVINATMYTLLCHLCCYQNTLLVTGTAFTSVVLKSIDMKSSWMVCVICCIIICPCHCSKRRRRTTATLDARVQPQQTIAHSVARMGVLSIHKLVDATCRTHGLSAKHLPLFCKKSAGGSSRLSATC